MLKQSCWGVGFLIPFHRLLLQDGINFLIAILFSKEIFLQSLQSIVGVNNLKSFSARIMVWRLLCWTCATLAQISGEWHNYLLQVFVTGRYFIINLQIHSAVIFKTTFANIIGMVVGKWVPLSTDAHFLWIFI